MTSRIEPFRAGERLSRDRLNEIVAAANYAARPTSSDPATVSQTAFGWHVAVAAPGALELVALDAALPAGGAGIATTVQRRDLDAGTMVAGEEGVRDVFDFGCGPLLPDTLGTATWLPSGGGRIVAPALNWHLAELTEELIAGGTANARLWTHDGGGGHADAGLNVTAWDWMLGGGESLASGSRVVVQFHPATRRWYALRSVGGGGAGETANPLVLFELTSTLAPGGTATAKELAWGGSAYGVVGSDFSLADPTDPGFWRGVSGYRGWCLFDVVRGEHVVVWMERKAERIAGTLTEDMGYTTSGQASSSVSDYYRGRDPGATLTVTDPMDRFGAARTGASYQATWDDDADAYVLTWCELPAHYVRFTLDDWLTRTDASQDATVEASWEGAAPSSPILVFNHEDDSVAGEYVFEGEPGATGLAVFDRDAGVYRAMWIECLTQEPP